MFYIYCLFLDLLWIVIVAAAPNSPKSTSKNSGPKSVIGTPFEYPLMKVTISFIKNHQNSNQTRTQIYP